MCVCVYNVCVYIIHSSVDRHLDCFHVFLWHNNSPFQVCVFVYTPHLLYPFSVTSVDRCLGYFHVLAVINSCSIATIGT